MSLPPRNGMAARRVIAGGSSSYAPGNLIALDQDWKWPLNYPDLTLPSNRPGDDYDGEDGFVAGQVTIQRSFVVEAGKTPALVVEVGLMAALGLGGEDGEYLSIDNIVISPIQTGTKTVGRVAFRYQPEFGVAK